MNINWFKDQDHLVYIDVEKHLDELEKQLNFPHLAQAASDFYAAPDADGVSIKGVKRTTAKLFIPDLTFGEHIEMGENLFLYLGEMNECYVLYRSNGIKPACECEI